LGEADALHGTSGDRVVDQLGGKLDAPHRDWAFIMPLLLKYL
jgi:hypothetical protein